MGDKLGLYLHIPFCRSKCAYCDFYSLAGREEQMDAYQNALLAHLKQTACTAHCPVDTVYFGGGTPSLFGEKRLLALLAAVKKYYKLDRDDRDHPGGQPGQRQPENACQAPRRGL